MMKTVSFIILLSIFVLSAFASDDYIPWDQMLDDNWMFNIETQDLLIPGLFCRGSAE